MPRSPKPKYSRSPQVPPFPLDFPIEIPENVPPSKPLVAIVGRPNVGKSTLFNKIVGHRAAIVDDVPGVTRDRNMAECDYQNRVFTIIDTGGLDLTAEDLLVEQIKDQSKRAMAEADLIIAVHTMIHFAR